MRKLDEREELSGRERPCFPELFRQQAERRGNAVAVIDATTEGERLSYRQLERRSERLAARLAGLGLEPEMRVGLFMERSADLLVAILGVWKAGGAYVPLDPSYPADRLGVMADDAGLALIVTHRRLRPPWNGAARLRILDLDLEPGAESDGAEERSARSALLRHPGDFAAYVIYTSGSTGRPKGVVIEHRSLAWYVATLGRLYGIEPRDRVLQFSSISFDLSVAEICLPLAHGATLILRGERMAESMSAFLRQCDAQAVSVMLPSTAFWHEMAAAVTKDPPSLPPSLRLVSFGGEAVLPERVAGWLEKVGRRVRLFNAYGPTEATVEATLYEFTEPRPTASVGRPVGGVEAYLLDRRGVPIPAGEGGELCLSGPGLARGYQARPGETAAKLVPHPFASVPGERLYRTGDLAHLDERGQLRVQGRIDHQIKVRGYRVEPEEIEARIAEHSAVCQAVVVPREELPGHRYLAAYVVPDEGAPALEGRIAQLRSFVGQRLPGHMVPSAWTFVAALPLTPNGKIDRAALVAGAPMQGEAHRHTWAPPRTPVERTLARIWSEALHLDQVGIHDDIFELGGDSILSIQIVARASDEGLHLTPKDLFQHSTIAELATVASTSKTVGAVDQGPVIGAAPLTPVQRWFFAQRLTRPWHFNQAVMLEVRRPLAPARLERAVLRLLKHHDALRLRFHEQDGKWRQTHAAVSGGPAPVVAVDIGRCRRLALPMVLRAATRRFQESLDLERGPLLRVAYFDRGPLPGRLFVVVHHLVIDAISWRVLIEDLESVYLRLEDGRPAVLPRKTTSFQAWARSLEAHAASEATRRELDYWLGVTRDAPRLPLDYPYGDVRDLNTRASADRVATELDAAETRLLLRQVPAAYRTQIHDLLLAALVLTFERWTGRRRLLVELQGHGREEALGSADLSRTVGWLSCTFPVDLEIGADAGPGEALQSVKEQLRQVPRRGIGYGLLRYLSGDLAARRSLAAADQPQVAFSYLGHLDPQFARSTLFDRVEEPLGDLEGRRGLRSHLVEVEALVIGERLWIHWRYSRHLHRRSTVEQLAKTCVEELRGLIAHCLEPRAGGFTASDFPHAGLSAAELRQWLGTDRSIEDVYPLVPVQEGILFHALYAPESQVYFEQNAWSLDGRLDAAAFRQAWERLMERHAILRTAFVWQGLERPLQVVRRRVALPFRELDWRSIDAAEREARFAALLEDDRRRGFALSVAPLLRCVLVRLGEREQRFVWSVHHLLLDGWSTALLLDELFELYESIHHGFDARIPRPRPFRDYVVWLGRQDRAAAERFWRRALEGFAAPTPLTADNGGGAAAPHDAGSQPHRQWRRDLDVETTTALRSFARQRHLTLNTLLQGAWAVVLARSSGTRDVVFGTTVADRPPALAGADAMIGLLIHTFPVRVRVAPRQRLAPWLARLQRSNLDLRQHGHGSLVDIHTWAAIPHDRPLFETSLGVRNFPGESAVRERHGELEISELHYFSQTHEALTILATSAERLELVASYAPARFPPVAVARLVGHLATVLAAMATAGASRALASLPHLTAAERHQLLREWNDTNRAAVPETTLPRLLARRVELHPDAAALCSAADGTDSVLSYRELAVRAEQLAAALRALPELSPAHDRRVGIFLERSPELVVTMLAALETGAAFCCLDPAYPEKRLAFMIDDAQPAVVVTREKLAGDLAATGVRCLCLETFAGRPSATVRDAGGWGESLAYVIYTSGSTGRPKGVMLDHRGLLNLAVDGHLGTRPGDRVLQFSSPSFDGSVYDVVTTLAAGAAIDLGAGGPAPLGDDLVRLLRRRRITRVTLPAAVARDLGGAAAEALPELRALLVVGEACPPELPAVWARPYRELLNGYGPTETTVCATIGRFRPAWLGLRRPPIGRPIGNVCAHLLDPEARPAAAGVAGELAIGGKGVGRGYLGDPRRTAERFVPAAAAGAGGARLYRTGDLVRRLDDGQLDFLGRIDQQVKIRGFRVEPGEIESLLRQDPAVRAAVVEARGHGAGRRLVAYLVLDPTSGRGSRQVVARLRQTLAERLPAFMLPASFVALEELPLTPGGKLDREALAARGEAIHPGVTTPFRPPGNDTEAVLSEIWSEVLGIDRIGVDDHFFELGGHSLLATQVVSRIRRRLRTELPLRLIFEAPTIAELAQRLEQAAPSALGELPSIERRPRDAEPLPLSFAQERLWFLDQLVPRSPAYNMDDAWLLEGALAPAALEAALNAIAARHEALRTTFPAAGGAPRQRIARELRIRLPEIDLRGLAGERRQRELARLADEEAHRPFDLARGPLLRALLLRLRGGGGPRSEAALLRTVHHVVSDGWSERIFYRELGELYDAAVRRRPAPLAPLGIQYADFALWQRRWLETSAEGSSPESPLDAQLAFWRRQLADLPRLDLTADRPRPPVQSYRGGLVRMAVGGAVVEALKKLGQSMHASLFMTLTAGMMALLSRYTGATDLVLGSPVAGRRQRSTEDLIGCFVNNLVLRGDLAGNPEVTEILARVRDTALQAFAHQDLPFHRLVEELQPERDLARSPLFQLVFALHLTPVEEIAAAGLRMRTIDLTRKRVALDLEIHLWESAQGLTGYAIYNADLFTAARLERLSRHFSCLLAEAASAPRRRLGELTILSATERHQLVAEWNDTRRETGAAASFHRLFELRAHAAPDVAALRHGPTGAQLSYGELNRRANRLARLLRRHGAGPGRLVAVLADRSPEMVAGWLAVWKAGGAFVPLDPSYPPQRLRFMLDDSGATLLLAHEVPLRGAARKVRTVLLGRGAENAERADDLGALAAGDDLAYVIYTSGSTGRPKGAMLTHRGLSNLATDRHLGTRAEDTLLQFASLSFDGAVYEVAMAFGAGATLDLAFSGPPVLGRALAVLLRQRRVTQVVLPPSALSTLPVESASTLPALRTVLAVGEACPAELPRRWSAPRRRFLNGYGPTEATVCSTIAELAGDGFERPPIGRPRPDNVRVQVLDARLAAVPVGAPGELHVAGAGLARGYLHRPRLTAERFVPDPNSTAGARLYRTGDRVRVLADGRIDFLGRIDAQVKLRGFRVELGEIEALLRDHPAVRDAAVTIHGSAGDRQLVAYMVPAPQPRTAGAAPPSSPQSDPGAQIVDAARTEYVETWRDLYDNLFRHRPDGGGAEGPATFDSFGWTSSFTGQAIPEDQMRQRVAATVERILAACGTSSPRVLEIGCGTGLLMWRIAPRAARYVGTDLSPVVIERLARGLGSADLGWDRHRVRLLCRSAEDFQGIETGGYDLVILNSVIQYFPDVEYLLAVLAGAVDACAPGGTIFLGDVRNLLLHGALCAAVELAKAAPTTPVAELQRRVAERRAGEEELLVDPAFFAALPRRFRRIHQVRLEPRADGARNELNGFRYDVALRLDEAGGPAPLPRPEVWCRDPSLAAIRRALARHPRRALGLSRVLDARLAGDVALLRLLERPGAAATAADLGREAARSAAAGVEPADLFALARDSSRTLLWEPVDHGRDGRYDAVFVPERASSRGAGEPAATGREPEDWSAWANDPLEGRVTASLASRMRSHLSERLPAYMVPSSFVVLSEMPLAPGGKIDRRRLPAPGRARPDLGTSWAAPRDAAEERLLAIWGEVLELDGLGVDDDFFELGGHSLLATQILSRIRQAFDVDLPLRLIFEKPTVAQLATAIPRGTGRRAAARAPGDDIEEHVL